MQIIILAAGQGSRLRPLTNDKPKCMVEFLGKPLLHHQLDLFEKADLENVTIIGGYKNEKIDYRENSLRVNERFAETNMVTTLFEASDLFDGSDDILITYGDIIFEEKVLDLIVNSSLPCSIVVDKGWKDLWSLRMDNPLEDAETFKLNTDGTIKELGKPPLGYDEIEGQYIGIIKFRADYAKKVLEHWTGMPDDIILDGQDKDNIYMTSFIQNLIDNGFSFYPEYINNGWLEIDTVEDLKAYERLIQDTTCASVFGALAQDN